MKAIASVALARNFNRAEVASAGLFVAGVLGILSITGLLHWFTRKIPVPVIKGILITHKQSNADPEISAEVGAGFTLIIYAGSLLKVPTPFTYRSANWIIVALAAFLILLWNPMYPRFPYALVVVIIGAFMGIILKSRHNYDGEPLRLGFWKPYVFVPSPSSFRVGALEAGLGQVPLTTLNSVIAVCFLSADLLPNVKAPSVTAVGMSVTMMNLVGCWFGSMPVCHGSGGLAAQYRFGARSGASVIFLGLVKLLLGLVAAPFAQAIFDSFPKNLLGIMVIAAGLELVGVGESLNTEGAIDLHEDRQNSGISEPFADPQGDKTVRVLLEEERKRRWTVMAITIGGLLAFHNDAIGFLADKHA
ncbi:hypothetical protein G7Y79_00003g011840 [Physcia stellaris]|nr:hypothetical protein G7Y79_00003g011840 [Physcia stellaris]